MKSLSTKRNWCKLIVVAFGITLMGQDALAGRDDKGSFDCKISETTAIQFDNGRSFVGRDAASLGKKVYVSYHIYDVPKGRETGKNDWWDYEVNIEGYAIHAGFQTMFSHSDTGTLTVRQDADEFRYFDSQGQVALNLTRSYREDWEGFVSIMYSDVSYLHGLRCRRDIESGQ